MSAGPLVHTAQAMKKCVSVIAVISHPGFASSALIAIFFGSLTYCHAQYDPEQWPKITLRVSAEGTLKDVFDSGLRPYRFPSLEKLMLEAKHARVTVLQSNGEALPEFAAEQIRIDPLQGGLLSGIEMLQHKTTLERARELMLPYLPKANRSVQELDVFLALVKADFLEYDRPGREANDFRVRWSDPGGPRYVVVFHKAFDPTRPLVPVLVIDWSQVRTPRERRSFYKEPVPPPPGYEGVSMQAPENFGPDSQIDILRSEGKPFAGDRPPSTVLRLKSATLTMSADVSGELPTFGVDLNSAIEKSESVAVCRLIDLGFVDFRGPAISEYSNAKFERTTALKGSVPERFVCAITIRGSPLVAETERLPEVGSEYILAGNFDGKELNLRKILPASPVTVAEVRAIVARRRAEDRSGNEGIGN